MCPLAAPVPDQPGHHLGVVQRAATLEHRDEATAGLLDQVPQLVVGGGSTPRRWVDRQSWPSHTPCPT